jgi:hypothetical protein
MMEFAASPPDRVRVIGALTGEALDTLLGMVKTTEVLLDLSEVREADAGAVRLLARLAPEWCDRFASPDWLALRIEMERRCPPCAVAG